MNAEKKTKATADSTPALEAAAEAQPVAAAATAKKGTKGKEKKDTNKSAPAPEATAEAQPMAAAAKGKKGTKGKEKKEQKGKKAKK